MEYRELGKTNLQVSSISYGAWAIGGTWGTVDDRDSMASLHKALDLGINFFDTADVYGDGRSERLIAQLRRERPEPFFVATKAGRRLPKQTLEGYTKENLHAWVARSLKNLEVESLDLLQLHCPSPDVYESDAVFAILDEMVNLGMIKHYGISVETVAEALRGIQHENVKTVQIIFNMFRLKPTSTFFAAAREAKVGILARVPLASGMLTGKLSKTSSFAPDDHRAFNRHGEHFDKGETFSGVDYDVALEAVEELKALVPEGYTLAQLALRWILMFPEISCAIPGAKTTVQVESNAHAANMPALSSDTMQKVKAIYDSRLKALVHDLW